MVCRFILKLYALNNAYYFNINLHNINHAFISYLSACVVMALVLNVVVEETVPRSLVSNSSVVPRCSGRHINVTLSPSETEKVVQVCPDLPLTNGYGNHSYSELYDGMNCTYDIKVFWTQGW